MEKTVSKTKTLSFGFGSSEPLVDISFSYDQQDKLLSVKVLSVYGVTAEGNIFHHFERSDENTFPPQVDENVYKIHLDSGNELTELKGYFNSLPDTKKSLSEVLLLVKAI